MLTSFRKHLVVQIGVGVTLFSLLAVFMMSLFTYTSSRNTLRQGALSEVDNIALGLEVTLKQWLTEQQQDFQALTTNGLFIEQLRDLIKKREAIPATRRSYHYLDRQLQALIASNPDFREVLILSRRGGEVLLSTTREHEGSFQQDSRFFVEGLKESAIIPIYYWPQTLEPTMTLSSPVKDAQGEAVGVIAVHLNLKHVLEHLSVYPTIARVGISYLVDKNHVPVGVSREAADSFPRGLHSKGIDAALAGENGVGVYADFLGQEVVGGYRWLDSFGLALLAEVPFSAALQPAGTLGLTIFAIGFVGTLIISGGLILLSRRIVRPVLEVSRAAKEVSSGNLEVAPVPRGSAEIGTLVESFNTMVKQIHALIEDVRNSEERYRTVFNASGEAIFIHASDNSRVLDYNLAARNIFGFEDGEVIEDIAEISAGYPPYSSEDALEKLILTRDKGPQVFEWRSRRKSGELFWTEVSLSKMEVGGEVRYLAVVRNIDQRKQNETELEEYRKNLEWTIEDRTRQL